MVMWIGSSFSPGVNFWRNVSGKMYIGSRKGKINDIEVLAFGSGSLRSVG